MLALICEKQSIVFECAKGKTSMYGFSYNVGEKPTKSFEKTVNKDVIGIYFDHEKAKDIFNDFSDTINTQITSGQSAIPIYVYGDEHMRSLTTDESDYIFNAIKNFFKETDPYKKFDLDHSRYEVLDTYKQASYTWMATNLALGTILDQQIDDDVAVISYDSDSISLAYALPNNVNTNDYDDYIHEVEYIGKQYSIFANAWEQFSYSTALINHTIGLVKASRSNVAKSECFGVTQNLYDYSLTIENAGTTFDINKCFESLKNYTMNPKGHCDYDKCTLGSVPQVLPNKNDIGKIYGLGFIYELITKAKSIEGLTKVPDYTTTIEALNDFADELGKLGSEIKIKFDQDPEAAEYPFRIAVFTQMMQEGLKYDSNYNITFVNDIDGIPIKWWYGASLSHALTDPDPDAEKNMILIGVIIAVVVVIVVVVIIVVVCLKCNRGKESRSARKEREENASLVNEMGSY